MELTGGGRAGGARGMPGVVVSRPRARGGIPQPGQEGDCAPRALPTGRGKSLGWAWSRGPRNFRSGRYAGREPVWKGVSPPPAGPGPLSYGNEGRGGAAAWLQCPPSSRARSRSPRAQASGKSSWSRQSPRLLQWEEQVSGLLGGQEGALGGGPRVVGPPVVDVVPSSHLLGSKPSPPPSRPVPGSQRPRLGGELVRAPVVRAVTR